jgi:hypothetical protein
MRRERPSHRTHAGSGLRVRGLSTLDRSSPALSQAEVWLKISIDDVAAAAKHLQDAGVVRCDEIEPLPEGFEGFWISNPASIVHIVAKPGY